MLGMSQLKPACHNSSKFYRYLFNADAVVGLVSSINGEQCSAMNEKFVESIITDNGVNDAVANVYALLETAITENCPKKYQKAATNRFPKNEWYDDEFKNLKHLTNDYAKTYDLNVQDNLLQYYSLKKSYKATTQRKKRIFQNKIRNELCELDMNNPCDYWKYWDRLHKNNSVSIASDISLDCFVKYFASVQAPPSDYTSTFDMQFLKYVEEFMVNFNNSPTNPSTYMTDHPITMSEVQTELKSLKLGKAPRIDGISNDFYKYLSDYLLQPLTVLFNYIWEKGVYPNKWSEGIIQPLHKKGSYSEPDNYRKLTLMACMGKIFEAILNKRLVFQSEATDIVDPNQFGISEGCRTSDNVFILDTIISYHKSIRKTLFITFIDFSKAFDFVNRSFLYYKMIKKAMAESL